MSHSVRFVMDDDDTVFKGRVLKSATGRQRQTTMVTKTPLQSETSSVLRWSSTAMDYTRKRRLLQKRSAKSRPNSPQNSGYTSLRRTFQHGVVRHREYYPEYEVKFNGSPLMLLPNARVRAQVNLDMFGSSLREGSVIPVDPNTTLQLSTVAAVFNPTHGAYGVRNPRWDRPMSSSGVVEIENGQLRYQRILPSRPSSVGDDSLPSSQSPEVESNSERASSDHLVLAPEYPEDLDSLFPVTTPSTKDRLPAYLDNYAKEAEVKLFGRRRNTIANIPSSSLPNPGQEKRISIDLPPVNHLNGIANYLDWIFTTFGDRKELQHLPRNNYVVRGSNPYFTNFVYKVPLHERVDGGEGQDDEEQVRQHPPQKSPLQPGRQNSYRVHRRHSVPVNLKAKTGCSGAEGRPGSPSSSVTRTDLDEDEMDMTVEFKNLIDVKITAVRKHSLGIKGTVSPRKKKTHPSVVSTGLQSPLPEPLNSSSISIESLGFPAKPEPEKPAQTPPKPPTSQKRKHGIVKKVRRPIERPQPVKKAPEPAPKASSPEPEPVETPVSTETPDSEAPPLPKVTAVIPDLPVLKSKEKTKAERKQSRSRRALIFNTNEPYINPELLEQMDSDQKLKKQMDINISPDNDESASKPASRVHPWAQGRLALSQQSSRFELPMDMKLLENLSPQDYIRKYCVISSRRQYLYQKIFYKSRDKSGYIPVKELEKALREVLVGTLTKQRVKELCDWLEINEDTKIDYKLFSGMAALAERILYPDFVTGDTQDIPEFQRDKIECADFGALSWKLNGIKVNPSVESLLKKIS